MYPSFVVLAKFVNTTLAASLLPKKINFHLDSGFEKTAAVGTKAKMIYMVET